MPRMRPIVGSSCRVRSGWVPSMDVIVPILVNVLRAVTRRLSAVGSSFYLWYQPCSLNHRRIGKLCRKVCHFLRLRADQRTAVSTVLGLDRRQNGRVANEVCHQVIDTYLILSCCRQAQNPANYRPMTTTVEPFIVRLAEPLRGDNRQYHLHKAGSSYHSRSCSNALSSPS